MLLAGVGDGEGVSGGGGTAWMLVRPVSDDVVDRGVEESFGELMKSLILRNPRTKNQIPRTKNQIRSMFLGIGSWNLVLGILLLTA